MAIGTKWFGSRALLIICFGLRFGEPGDLRLEFAFGIANEQPADRHRRRAAAIPDGGATGDFDEAVGSAVPEADAVALPGDFGIVEDGGELFQALAFDRRPAPAVTLLPRGRAARCAAPPPADHTPTVFPRPATVYCAAPPH